MSTAAKNVSREAIADQLELMAKHVRDGTAIGFAAYWDDHRLARFSITHQDGREEDLPLPGIELEGDESADE